MAGDLPACYGFGVGSIFKKFGNGFIFKNVIDSLSGSDVVFGNLECVLSEPTHKTNYLPDLYLRGVSSFIKDLNEAGFNVLSVSNNHSLQHGIKPFYNTIKLLVKNEILPIGLKGSGSDFYCTPTIIDKNSCIIGLLSYSLIPEEYYKSETEYSQPTIQNILQDIHSLKQKVDIVLVSLHWGDEYIGKPSFFQIKNAHSMIDAGADILIGHHPHVLQGIETYKQKIIAYSLGNFVFDMWTDATRESIILDIQIDNKMVVGYAAIPIKINRYYQPVPLSGIEKQKILNLLNTYEYELNSFKEINYTKRYQDELRIISKKQRMSTWKHYLKNLYKFHPYAILQIFGLVIMRRILKKKIG